MIREREPEVALAFSPDPWVVELHRHLADHGGARVRSLVLDPAVARAESYDVLVVGHRWSPLTRALVSDVRELGRAVLGIFDRDEPASRTHLTALGVDGLLESDAGPDGFVRAIAAVAGRRGAEPRADVNVVAPRRVGRVIAIGGPPGVGRTEISVQLALSFQRHHPTHLFDADDVAPAIAQRLHLPIEPNLHSAIDAVEHGRGELDVCLTVHPRSGLRVLAGLGSASSWSQVRPGEIMRVLEEVASQPGVVVVDGAGSLDELAAFTSRGRHATARALVTEADVLVAVCDASPHGLTRLFNWAIDARALAAETPLVVVVNRAPEERYQRAELYDEIRDTLPAREVAFVAFDPKVARAAWHGEPVASGRFTRVLDALADRIDAC
jgi:MinD-like ATPase involved in chromosome partitioning or flagellar assembly